MKGFVQVGVIFDDYTETTDIEDKPLIWAHICKSCVEKHDIGMSLTSQYGGREPLPICGVENCENEAGYYLDFTKGEAWPCSNF
ncbi:MAG: hypothetical protein FWB97_08755 [Oscillospiraceae bacterium]|nr:hypothetical protein [Oscillospiraceae bacterium]